MISIRCSRLVFDAFATSAKIPVSMLVLKELYYKNSIGIVAPTIISDVQYIFLSFNYTIAIRLTFTYMHTLSISASPRILKQIVYIIYLPLSDGTNSFSSNGQSNDFLRESIGTCVVPSGQII